MEILFAVMFFGCLLFSVYKASSSHLKKKALVQDKNSGTIHSAGHYKRVQREKDFTEWNNEYIGTLREAFLNQYKIPYNEAQLAYVAYNNYVDAKKVIDDIGDRAYSFDDCPRTKSLIVDGSISSNTVTQDDFETSTYTTFDGSSVTKFIPRKSFNTSYITAGMITANKISVGGPVCSCESCDFNAKMDTYNQRKRIWDHTKGQISSKYPEFVFENLPEELPELSV